MSLLGSKHTGSSNSLYLFLSYTGEEPGLDNDGLLGENTLAKNLKIKKNYDKLRYLVFFKNWSFATFLKNHSLKLFVINHWCSPRANFLIISNVIIELLSLLVTYYSTVKLVRKKNKDINIDFFGSFFLHCQCKET